jgi:uncharacterized membrane protein YccC
MEQWIALRNSIGVTLPLVVGTLLKMPLSGLAVSTGALQVSYSDGHNPYAQRAKRMLTASLLCALAVVAGGLAGRNSISAIIIPALAAFAAGLAVSLGPAADSLGVISLVTLIIFAAQPLTPSRAVLSGLLALGGGLLQTALALMLWPVRRYQPEQRALADFYGVLSRVAVISSGSREGPPATDESTAARETLAGLGSDNSLEAARFWSLLNQGERIRLSVLTLRRLQKRMARNEVMPPRLLLLQNFLESASRVLGIISQSLLTGMDASSAKENLLALEQQAAGWRKETEEDAAALLINIATADTTSRTSAGTEAGTHAGTRAMTTAMANDARYQMDALAGQLRSAVRTVSEASPAGLTALEQREAKQHWKHRMSSQVATLRANLTLKSAAFRHALRMSLCLAFGEIVAYQIRGARSYWLAMTIVLVLKREFTATFSRGVLRIAGTIIGLLLATGLFHFLPLGMGMKIALVGVFTFLLRWAGGANYGVFTIAVSALIVMMVAFTGVSPKAAILARGEMTCIGGVIALAAYLIWPTWERSLVGPNLAEMLESYREYFHAVVEAHLPGKLRNEAELDRLRMAARVARTNMDASADRLRAEPGTLPEKMQLLTAMLANCHRFVRAIMALEVVPIGAEPARRELVDFARDVEKTVQVLCAALRAEKTSFRTLPDLREDHHRLVSAASSDIVRYALVNEETDRITNSLNTLREQIVHWNHFPA